jgi:hypothetical protein
MESVIVRISGKTNRGKYLIGLLKDLAKNGNDIKIVDIPNEETRDSIQDARQKKGHKASSAKDLFDQIKAS